MTMMKMMQQMTMSRKMMMLMRSVTDGREALWTLFAANLAQSGNSKTVCENVRSCRSSWISFFCSRGLDRLSLEFSEFCPLAKMFGLSLLYFDVEISLRGEVCGFFQTSRENSSVVEVVILVMVGQNFRPMCRSLKVNRRLQNQTVDQFANDSVI